LNVVVVVAWCMSTVGRVAAADDWSAGQVRRLVYITCSGRARWKYPPAARFTGQFCSTSWSVSWTVDRQISNTIVCVQYVYRLRLITIGNGERCAIANVQFIYLFVFTMTQKLWADLQQIFRVESILVKHEITRFWASLRTTKGRWRLAYCFTPTYDRPFELTLHWCCH